jgi:antiviral defense system Shedu protein SduA
MTTNTANVKSKTLKFLPKGTQVLASVKLNGQISTELSKHLVKLEDNEFVKCNNRYTKQVGCFVPITVEEDLTITFKITAAGKVQRELDQSLVKSPALSNGPYTSLNNILQEISHLYEPKRASHGGKVYDYVFFQDSDMLWKPLEILRERIYLPFAAEFEPWILGVPISSKDHPRFNHILEGYKKALVEFRERLKGEYPETSGNNSWQCWIRNNFWLFGATYRQPLPKVKVGFDSIPDFLFATLDGFLDFLEIKLPQHSVIRQSNSHAGAYRWSGEANEAIGQAIQYLSEIDKNQYQIAENIQINYGLDLSTIKPRALILIGQSTEWKVIERTALRKLNNSLYGIDVMTYTDLLQRGERLVKIFSDGVPDAVAERTSAVADIAMTQ